MNKENVLKIANTVFDDINTVSGDIYKGELKINSKKPAGIYFLDMNENIPYDTFSDYQEKLLAEEYYKHPGNLQWNYYLLLLQDGMDPSLKEKIERDDKYARKYVFTTEKEFEDFFKLESSSAQFSGNIVLDWKKQLNTVGLQDIYTKISYVDGVSNFIENRNKKPILEPKTSGPTKQEPLNFINKITLKSNYREYPIHPKTFNFGKVNLIKGINGVGKTSLFEAIELVTCGKTFRNSDKIEPDGCIEAIFNNNTIHAEACTPSKTEKYRVRDLFWYSNDYPRDNFTYTSFNRFNFFNTDAANNLVTSNNEENIKKALFNLVLGPEYNYITERMNGFHTRIRPEFNNLKEGMKNAEELVALSKKTIARLQSSNAIQSLQEVIQTNIHDLKFLNKNFNLETDIVQVETLVNQLNVYLEVFSNEKSYPLHSYAEVLNNMKILFERQGLFNEFRSALEITNLKIQEEQKVASDYHEKIKLLTDSLKYFVESRSFDINGMSARISENDLKIRIIEFIKKSLASFNIQDYALTGTPKDEVTKNNDGLSRARSELMQVEANINNLLKQFDKIGQMINQIKILGKEFIAADPDAHICPLCQTDFQRIEFIERVDAITSSNTISSREIEILSQRQSTLKNEIDAFTQGNNHINSINVAYESIADKNMSTPSVAQMVELIIGTLSDENNQLQLKSEFKAFNDWLHFNGLSENEFNHLKNEIDRTFGDTLQFSFEQKNTFEIKLNQINELLRACRSNIEDLILKKANLTNEFKTKSGLDPEKEYVLKEIKNLLDEEKSKLELYEETFKKIKGLIVLGDNVMISDLKETLSLLGRNIATLRAAIQNQFELKNAETEKLKGEAYITTNTEKFNRVKKGFEILDHLVKNNGTEQLDGFFTQNLNEVNDIFQSIHTPREFKSFTFRDKQLLLITENDVPRKISEISTGQRAALALSIFISLNRKLKNGPNIIIFDDPISHIDDLNALSFLDFLRFFVLREKKQIFFATANARLADLVEKKFEFLEEDFKKWELKR
jgi:DNA repair protein SbcC/Rad50